MNGRECASEKEGSAEDVERRRGRCDDVRGQVNDELEVFRGISFDEITSPLGEENERARDTERERRNTGGTRRTCSDNIS